MSFDPYRIIRKNVEPLLFKNNQHLPPQTTGVLFNANENALGSPSVKWYNRFPSKDDLPVKKAIAAVKGIAPGNVLLEKGNFECLDLLVRCFCEPESNIIICPPCDGLYENIAQLNAVNVKIVPLLPDFQLDMIHLESSVDEQTNIIIITSPNSIAGNAMSRRDVESILNNFNGIVVIDETYVNFSRQKSFIAELVDYPNVVVLQNFDIAWGLAGLQVSILLASQEMVSILEAINSSYSINTVTQEVLLKALEEPGMVNDMIKELVQMRAALKHVLEKFYFIENVYPSDANFLLVKMNNAKKVFDFLLKKEILVMNASGNAGCENCLRITIGTEQENTKLVEALVDYFDEEKLAV